MFWIGLGVGCITGGVIAMIIIALLAANNE